VGIVLEVGYIVAVAVGYIQLLAIDSFVDHSFVVVALVVGIALVEDIVVAFALAFALASALAFALASALASALAFALALAFGKRVVLGIEVSSLVDI